MIDWYKAKLDDIVEITSSKRIYESDYTLSGVPFFRGKEIGQMEDGQNITDLLYISPDKFETIKKRFPVPEKGDILLTSVGSIGIPWIVGNERFYFKDGNLTWFRNYNNRINNIFLYYWMKTGIFKKQIFNNNIGVAQKALTIVGLKEITIFLPDVSNQKAIAGVLRSLDEKIELNRKINSELETLARTIYTYTFLQNKNPEWKTETLFKNSLTTIIKPKIDKFTGEKTYLDTSTVNGIEIGEGEKITYENRASRANMQPVANSVWFAKMKDSIKQIFVSKNAHDLLDNCVLSTGFMGLKVREDAFEYLCCYMMSGYVEIAKNSIAGGSSMVAIGNDDLKWMKIAIPDDTSLINFQNTVKPIFAEIIKNRQESAELARTRDFLLPLLMTGQVNV